MREFQAVIFDTETTGLIKPDVIHLKEQPRIIELYCMKILHKSDGTLEVLDELETLFSIPEQLPTIITKITGITEAMLDGQPTFAQKFNEIAEFHIGIKRWIAHNLAFDSCMMANEVSRLGKVLHFPFPPDHFCTVQKTLHIEQRRMTLASLYKELFGTGFIAHRAKNDVEALFRCYKEILKM